MTREEWVKDTIRKSLLAVAIAFVGGVATTCAMAYGSDGPLSGYGRCWSQYCNCKQYGGTGWLCDNCGHKFGWH